MSKPTPKVHRVARWLRRGVFALLDDAAALRVAFAERWPSLRESDLIEGAKVAIKWAQVSAELHGNQAERLIEFHRAV